MARPPPALAVPAAPDPVALAAQVTAAARVIEGHVDTWIAAQPKAERYEVGVGWHGSIPDATLDLLVGFYRVAGWTKARAQGALPVAVHDGDGKPSKDIDVALVRWDGAGWMYDAPGGAYGIEGSRIETKLDPRGIVLYLDR